MICSYCGHRARTFEAGHCALPLGKTANRQETPRESYMEVFESHVPGQEASGFNR